MHLLNEILIFLYYIRIFIFWVYNKKKKNQIELLIIFVQFVFFYYISLLYNISESLIFIRDKKYKK